MVSKANEMYLSFDTESLTGGNEIISVPDSSYNFVHLMKRLNEFYCS